jgi:hypothetical protein
MSLLSLILAAGPIWCTPPDPPYLPTDDGDLEEWREVIKDEFNMYFKDSEDYVRCLDRERARVLQEMGQQAHRMNDFLDQSLTQH